MSLLDDSSGLMDGFGVEGVLGDSGLKSAVEQLVQGETQHVIELEFFSGEEPVSVHSSEKGGTFKQPS